MVGEWNILRAQQTFHAKQHFLKLQENCKNQEINRIKSKKINKTVKLCTLATKNLILS